jgi:uncharacterized protein (TIGR00369 family)
MKSRKLKLLLPSHYGTLSAVLGLKLLSASKGRVKMALPWSKAASQSAGLLHGGALATLTDTAAAVGTLFLLPEGWRTVTGELKINYLGNIQSGTALAEAVCLHHGKRTMVWEIKVTKAGSRQLLALSTSTFFLLPPEKSK